MSDNEKLLSLQKQLTLPLKLIVNPDYQDFIRKCRENIEDQAPFLVWADFIDEWADKNADHLGARIKAYTLRNPECNTYEDVKKLESMLPYRDVLKKKEIKILDWISNAVAGCTFTFNGTRGVKLLKCGNILDLHIFASMRKLPVPSHEIGRILATNPICNYVRNNVVLVASSTVTGGSYVIFEAHKLGAHFEKFVRDRWYDHCDTDNYCTIYARYSPFRLCYPGEIPEKLQPQKLVNDYFIEETDRYVDGVNSNKYYPEKE